ncbi:uncharacterized protein EDB91DRAFT_673334 [Suillus paluster]|uniref:uncharacterized protein n=1 Tax=Suillus paluster TaxID=48578 RepID=UPI001B85C3FE|nr:uncharacterized protein EDB91DRAFT_673334 [Suillus paluster]KAG1732411.1 hypothetical protein EDB91DRAFT_673334 [Suillus paluster]
MMRCSRDKSWSKHTRMTLRESSGASVLCAVLLPYPKLCRDVKLLLHAVDLTRLASSQISRYPEFFSGVCGSLCARMQRSGSLSGKYPADFRWRKFNKIRPSIGRVSSLFHGDCYITYMLLMGPSWFAWSGTLMAVLSVNTRQIPWLVPGSAVFNWSPRAC